MNYLNILFAFLPSVGGSLTQSVTGFGYGIFVMVFFPLFLNMFEASSLSTIMSVWLNAQLAIKYRRHCDYNEVWYPTAVYTVFSYLAMYISKLIPVSSLTAYFGLFLIAVSAYFTFFSNKIKLKANLLTATVCSILAGLASGFFAIGGPPMVLYYLAVAGDDKEKYFGTIQMFFFITSIFSTASRIMNGMVTKELIPLIIPGIVGIVLGSRLGGKIVDKINIEQLKRIIYIFLAVAGMVTFLKAVI